MRSTKRAVYTGLAAVGIVLGAAGLANAATNGGASNIDTAVVSDQIAGTVQSVGSTGEHENEADDATENDTGTNDETPEYTSSVTTADAGDTSVTGDESGESTALAPLATVTADDASAAALASQPGTVIKVELENENGNVVYGVEIDTGSGTVDVKVDAGNATVLATEADGHDGEHAD